MRSAPDRAPDLNLLEEYKMERDQGSDSSEELNDGTKVNAKDEASSSTSTLAKGLPEDLPPHIFNLLSAVYGQHGMWGAKVDGSLITVLSSFDEKLLKRQLKSSRNSGIANPVWQLGVDHQVLARMNHHLPAFLVSLQKVVRYHACSDRNTFKRYIASLADERNRALSILRRYIGPNCNAKEEATPEFKQLAADFFGGREVLEDYSVVDISQNKFDTVDSSESKAEVESDKSYKITYEAGDRVEVLHSETLHDTVLVTFLLDIILSQEIQQIIDKDAKFRSMKVYYNPERTTMMSRITSVELSHARGESAWWKGDGFKLNLRPDGSMQDKDNEAITITRIDDDGKIGSEDKGAPRIVELDVEDIPEEVEAEPKPSKPKKKKKGKKVKSTSEVEEKSELTESNEIKKSPDTEKEVEESGATEAKDISEVKEDGNTQPLRNGEAAKSSIREVAQPSPPKSNKKAKVRKAQHKSEVENTGEASNAKEASVAKEDLGGKKDVDTSNTPETSNETGEKSDPKVDKENADGNKVTATPDGKETSKEIETSKKVEASKEIGDNLSLENLETVAIVEETSTGKNSEQVDSHSVATEQLPEEPIPQATQPNPAKSKKKTRSPKVESVTKDDNKSMTAELATADVTSGKPPGKDTSQEAEAKSAKPKNKSKAKEAKEHGNTEDHKKSDAKKNKLAEIPQTEEVNMQEDTQPESKLPAKKNKKKHGKRGPGKTASGDSATASASNSAESQLEPLVEPAKSTLNAPLNEISTKAKSNDGTATVDAKADDTRIAGNTDGNVAIDPIDMTDTNATPSEADAKTRNLGWKQVKKPKAAKNVVSQEDQVLPIRAAPTTHPAPVVQPAAKTSLPATATPQKARRDSVQSASTIVSPSAVDLNYSVLTSDHAADTSALSSVGDVSKLTAIGAEGQQPASLPSTDVSPVNTSKPLQSAAEVVGITGDHYDTKEKKDVPGDDRQGLPSQQAKQTPVMEAGDPPKKKEEAPLQMTRVRDPRVLAIQFGDMPIGFGLELPLGTSREPRIIFPHTKHCMADSDSDDEPPTANLTARLKAKAKAEAKAKAGAEASAKVSPPVESPSTSSSKYYTPSPMDGSAMPIMQFSESQFNNSGAVQPLDTVHGGRGSGFYSVPHPPGSHATASTNEIFGSGSMYGEQMPPSIGGFSYPAQQYSQAYSPPAEEETPSPFTCFCCKVTRRPTAEAPVYICPFCGPLRNLKYCSRDCLLADAWVHRGHCRNSPASQSITNFNPPSWCVYDKDALLTLQDWGTVNRAIFRQKMFSMYCFSGPFPKVLQQWMVCMDLNMDRERTYPADVDDGHITGDYHIFRSEVSATGRFSPTEVLTTFCLPENDPMKVDFNRLLNACFMFAKLDRSLIVFLYRLLRHFIYVDSYYCHTFPAVPREVLYPEFKNQFNQEFGVWFPDNAEPPVLDMGVEWLTVHCILCRYEQTYPDLLIHLTRKLPYSRARFPVPTPLMH